MNRQQRRAEERRRKKHKRVTLERRDGGQPVELTLVEAYRAAYEAQQQGQLDQAIYIYNQILATEPGHIDALTNLGMIANMTGHSEEALKLLESALAKGRPTAELYLNYGVALRGVGRIGDAVAVGLVDHNGLPVVVRADLSQRRAHRKFHSPGKSASQMAHTHQSSLIRLRWPHEGQRRKQKAAVKAPG